MPIVVPPGHPRLAGVPKCLPLVQEKEAQGDCSGSHVFSQLDGHWFLSVYVFNIMHIYLTATMSLVTHHESCGFEMFVYR
jgi:hypothetical protein